MASCQDNLDKLVPPKCQTILDFLQQEMTEVEVVTTGRHADHLHQAPVKAPPSEY